MLVGLEPVIQDERPDAVLVYGDTNSTLAGALVAAKLAGADRARRGRPALVRPAHAGGAEPDGRRRPRRSPLLPVRHRRHEPRAPRASPPASIRSATSWSTSPRRSRRSPPAARTPSPRLGVEPGGYVILTAHRPANTLPETIPALVEVIEALEMPVVFPVHPRTRAALERAGLLERAAAAAHLTAPLGYLDFTALLMSAAVCLTDSGGVQKEAYLHRVPCVTLRDTTEWVETIATGWNRLADARAGRGRRPRSPRRRALPSIRRSTATAMRPAASPLSSPPADSIRTACQRTSESSALATWACRWPSNSAGPGARWCASSRTAARSRRSAGARATSRTSTRRCSPSS